jgi:hypothetical protein
MNSRLDEILADLEDAFADSPKGEKANIPPITNSWSNKYEEPKQPSSNFTYTPAPAPY